MKIGQLGELAEASDVVVGQVQVGQGHQLRETLEQGVKWRDSQERCQMEEVKSFPHRNFFYSVLMKVEAF